MKNNDNLTAGRYATMGGSMSNSNMYAQPSFRYINRPTRRVYVASSWCNLFHPNVVSSLLQDGHEVYDFKDVERFNWSEINPEWRLWDTNTYIAALALPQVERGFSRDMNALISCDVCVYVTPCGVSASFEAGWACGAGKRVYAYMPVMQEPELMLKMTHTVTDSLDEIRRLVALTNAEHLSEQIEKGR